MEMGKTGLLLPENLNTGGRKYIEAESFTIVISASRELQAVICVHCGHTENPMPVLIKLTSNHDKQHTGEDKVVHVEERASLHHQGARHIRKWCLAARVEDLVALARGSQHLQRQHPAV